jgi:hypothetical protein
MKQVPLEFCVFPFQAIISLPGVPDLLGYAWMLGFRFELNPKDLDLNAFHFPISHVDILLYQPCINEQESSPKLGELESLAMMQKPQIFLLMCGDTTCLVTVLRLVFR